jgi:hypothetical protein
MHFLWVKRAAADDNDGRIVSFMSDIRYQEHIGDYGSRQNYLVNIKFDDHDSGLKAGSSFITIYDPKLSVHSHGCQILCRPKNFDES